MYQGIARRTADWLVQGDSIAEEDREVYEFGLDKLFSMLSNLFFAAGIGLLFGMFTQTVVFYVSYIALRVYAGGYHADTPLRRFFISIGIIIPCLLMIRFQDIWNVPFAFYGLLGISAAALVLLGSVGSRNKMPDEVEKIVYRRRLLRNLAVIAVAAIVLSALSFPAYASAVLCGILLAATIAAAGKVKLSL